VASPAEIASLRRTHAGAKFKVTLARAQPRQQGEPAHTFLCRQSKTFVRERELPLTLNCHAGEKISVRARMCWEDYSETPAPRLGSLTVTSRTATLTFDWLADAFCVVQVWHGQRLLPLLRVFPAGCVSSGDLRLREYRATYAGLLPDSDYVFEIIGQWRDEEVASLRFPRHTTAAALPGLTVLSVNDGEATLYLDTEHHDLAVHCIIATQQDDDDILLPPGLVEERGPDPAVSARVEAGNRICLQGLSPGVRYEVVVRGRAAGALLRSEISFLVPPRRLSLMELLGFDFGDWHDLGLAELKRQWFRWLRVNHPDKGGSAPMQHVHLVLQKGAAAVEKMRAGKKLLESDFLTAKEVPSHRALQLSAMQDKIVAEDKQGRFVECDTHATVGDLRKKAEVEFRAPVDLYVGPCFVDVSRDGSCALTVVSSQAPAHRVTKGTETAEGSAPQGDFAANSPQSPPATPPFAHAASEQVGITSGLLGAAFAQLLFSGMNAGGVYRLLFGKEGEAGTSHDMIGAPPGQGAMLHMDHLQPATAYKAQLLSAAGHEVAAMTLRTMPSKAARLSSAAAPEAQEEDEGDDGGDKDRAEEKRAKKKRQWSSRCVSTTRLVSTEDLLPATCVEIHTDAVCLKVPPSWELSLELDAGAGWVPWCTRSEGVHFHDAPMPYGVRHWRLTGRSSKMVPL
jgi:hypothetical protein